jgi:hypothetical protein
MTKLENLTPNASVRGILPDCLVTVVNVQWFGSEALELTYKDSSGRVANQLLYRHDEPNLEVVQVGRPWSFDGDGHLFRLVSEAHRIRLPSLPAGAGFRRDECQLQLYGPAGAGGETEMTDPTTIRVFDVVAGPLCVSAEDGQHVHDRIAPLLREGKPVTLSFAGVKTIIAAFLSAAIGQLCGEFPEAHVCGLLTIRDLAADDRALLDRVIRNAQAYYANPAAFDAAWQDELGDDDARPSATADGAGNDRKRR